MSRLVAAFACTAACAVALPSSASHYVNHQPPQKAAKVRFAPGFPALKDHEWGFALGGFGGVRRHAQVRHAPVIFVHGNNVDHTDWYPVRDDFKAAGWTDQELWALSYNGLGSANGGGSRLNPEATAERREMGGDGVARVTNNDNNVPDLFDFILGVRAYTGSRRFSIVSHSLGVTLARKTLKVHPELRNDLVAFVGIAGGNHGTSLCEPAQVDWSMACDEVRIGSPWLDALNGPGGSDETYVPARWLTLYEGTGLGDVAYLGPSYAKSPRLEGPTTGRSR